MKNHLIEQLADIEIEDLLSGVGGADDIYANFSKNFKRLGDFKRVRRDHEDKNFVMRWWDNDKLKGAHLDSVEVQAEFSKTLGQLLMISVVHAKRMTEQQKMLNRQQEDLSRQTASIAKNTGEIRTSQEKQSQQAKEIETLVRTLFEVKGLTEDGAQALVRIAKEVKATKDNMIAETSKRLSELNQALDKEVTRLDDDLRSLGGKAISLVENDKKLGQALQVLDKRGKAAAEEFAAEIKKNDELSLAKLTAFTKKSEAIYERTIILETQLEQQKQVLSMLEQKSSQASISLGQKINNLMLLSGGAIALSLGSVAFLLLRH